MEVTRLVERALRDSRAVDLEALCVLAGQKVCRCFVQQWVPGDAYSHVCTGASDKATYAHIAALAQGASLHCVIRALYQQQTKNI